MWRALRPFLALLLVAAVLVPAPAHADPPLPRLHVSDGRIVDAEGRSVLLRGVNVNQLVEYWEGTEFPTVFPLRRSDFDLIASFGWNAVRLLVSWSRVEPSPGDYDEAYLDRVSQAARWAGQRGIYVIVDLHQDAWGPHLDARPDETCPPGSHPAIGWDGAPEWATLHDDLPRCYAQTREVNQAVAQSFQSFWVDRPGPDGVGIQTRYHAMLAHLAQRFTDPWIAGFDLMNEPNPGYLVGANGSTLLQLFHARALDAIRSGQEAAGAAPSIVFFEPSAEWGIAPVPAPPFTTDPNVVWAPHFYAGSITPGDVEAQFAVAEAQRAAYGGIPMLIGEWGADPGRAGPQGDGYFVQHQDLHDEHLASSTMWTWRESCGDPHKAEAIRAGEVPGVWGLFEVDCRTNEILGMRTDLRDEVMRAYPRAAPGRLTSTAYEHETGAFVAGGSDAEAGTLLEVVYPSRKHAGPVVDAHGLERVRVKRGPGRDFVLITARASGGDWTIGINE